MPHLNLLRILFLAVAAVLTVTHVGARQSREISPDKLQTELSRLDRLLDNRENMINVRMRRIDNLRAQAVKTPNPENLHALADAFDDINNDSVMVYLQLAIDASSDSTERNRLRMQLASVMPLGGLFAEAQTKFNSVDTVSLSDAQKLDYYLYGRNLYYNIAQFFQDRPNFNEPWERRMAQYQARYLNALSNGPDDNRYRLAFGEYLFRTGKTADAQTVLRDVFQTESADTHVRSRSAYLMSQIARQQKDPDAYI